MARAGRRLTRLSPDAPSLLQWGHSMVVDPMGLKLTEADEKEAIVFATIGEWIRDQTVTALLPHFAISRFVCVTFELSLPAFSYLI